MLIDIMCMMKTVYRYQEIAFLVDSSPKADSGTTSWPYLMSFINGVINSLYLQCSTCYRYALVRYSDDANVQFNLTSPSPLSTLQQYVSSTTYSPGSGSNLTRALDIVRMQVLNKENRRQSSSAVAVVITDNLPASSNTPDLQTAVLATKTSGIRVMVIGISAGRIDASTLYQLSLCKDISRTYMMTMADDYRLFANSIDLVAQGVVKSLPLGSPASCKYCSVLLSRVIMRWCTPKFWTGTPLVVYHDIPPTKEKFSLHELCALSKTVYQLKETWLFESHEAKQVSTECIQNQVYWKKEVKRNVCLHSATSLIWNFILGF